MTRSYASQDVSDSCIGLSRMAEVSNGTYPTESGATRDALRALMARDRSARCVRIMSAGTGQALEKCCTPQRFLRWQRSHSQNCCRKLRFPYEATASGQKAQLFAVILGSCRPRPS